MSGNKNSYFQSADRKMNTSYAKMTTESSILYTDSNDLNSSPSQALKTDIVI